MKKKILSVAIAIYIMAGLIPATTYATENMNTYNNKVRTTNTINLSECITDTAIDNDVLWEVGREIPVGTTIYNNTEFALEIIYAAESVSSIPTGAIPEEVPAGGSKEITASGGGITTTGQWKLCGNRKGGSYGEPATGVKYGIVLYPVTSAEYKVTFQMNGQGTAPADITGIKEGNKITAPTAPTATGYTFGGWYKEAGCINAWDFANDTVTADTILYAKWTQVPSTAPVISAITPTGGVYGYTEGTAKVAVTVAQETGYTYTYQWYSNTTNANTGGTVISGATSATYNLPAGKNAGDYYFYCVVTSSGNGNTATTTSNVATITIEKKELGITWSNTAFTYDGTTKVPTATVTGLVGADTCTVEGGQVNANVEGMTYTATATIFGSANYKLPSNITTTFTIEKAEMNVTVNAEAITNGYGYKLVVKVISPTSGAKVKYGTTEGNYTLDDSPVLSSYGSLTVYYQVTETSGNYKTLTGAKKMSITDSVEPTGSLKVGSNSFSSFVDQNKVSFSTYLSAPQKVTIAASDSSSGVDKIHYYLSQSALTLAQVKALKEDAWSIYSTSFNLYDDKKYIVYAKITDKAGNIGYISTNGIIVDGTDPVIKGIEDEGEECQSVSITVTDTYLSTVTLDNSKKTVSNGKATFTVTGDGKEHTLTATDKAGNETEYTFKVYSSHEYGDFKQTKVEGEWSLEEAECKRECGKKYKRYRQNTDIRVEEDPSGGSVSVDVEVKTGAPTLSVKGLDTDVAKKLVAGAETQAAKGVDVLVYLDVTKQSSVGSTDKTATENAIKQSTVQNLKEGMYLDLSMYKKEGSGTASKISNATLTKKLTFSMTLPDTLKAPAGKSRTYYVVRVHNGTATVLNTTLKDNVINFETDRFSTYSIWYTEGDAAGANATAATNQTTTATNGTTGQKDKVPQTGDADYGFWYGLLCLIGGIGTIYFGRKKFLK